MRWIASLAWLLLAAAPPAMLTIDGQSFAQKDIVDARAIADGSGAPIVLVTFSPAAAERYAQITLAKAGKPVALAFGSQTLATPVVAAPTNGGSIQISGAVTFKQAIALAKRISGKAPLPESDGE